MNKKLLKIELDLNFILIAITTPLKGYKLCFLINKYLELGFERTEFDYSFQYLNQNTRYFSQFFYKNPNENDFFLIANKGNQGYLIPELKEIDYFMLLKNFFDDEDLQFIIKGLKSIPEIQGATEISPYKLKSKENLIF